MKLLLVLPADRSESWRLPLSTALPDATIACWPEAPPDPDYVLCWKPPADVFVRARPRKAIFNLGAGVDALMNVSTLPSGIPIVRLEDAGMAIQMAEYVTLAVLRAYREADAYAAQQRERKWQSRPRIAKSEFGIGILGLGLLGRTVASAILPFGFPLAGWSRERKTIAGVESYAGKSELAKFLARSKVLVCLLPVTDGTRGLLDRRHLSMLPAGAHLINIARGEIIVDDDLLAVLDDAHLASATLDVFREEPLPRSHRFWDHPRVILTPHNSALTLIDESVTQIVAKIRQIERDERVSGLVDRSRGY